MTRLYITEALYTNTTIPLKCACLLHVFIYIREYLFCVAVVQHTLMGNDDFSGWFCVYHKRDDIYYPLCSI